MTRPIPPDGTQFGRTRLSNALQSEQGGRSAPDHSNGLSRAAVFETARGLGLPMSNIHAPAVSVIVRSIGRPTLERGLESIAAQAYHSVEILLVEASGRRPPPV